MMFFRLVLIYCTLFFFFFFNDTATTEIYTLSLHDALPILRSLSLHRQSAAHRRGNHPRGYRQQTAEEAPAGKISSSFSFRRCSLLTVMATTLIDGESLSPELFHEVVVGGRQVAIDPEARTRVERARAVVEQLVRHDEPAYAITTGVGKLSDVRIAPEQNRELQLNLIRSHAVGVGEPLTEAETRGMMLLRANSLAKGNSGVRPIVIDTLCQMLNNRVHPVIPSQGSVGASGDLAPLSHLALVVVGE